MPKDEVLFDAHEHGELLTPEEASEHLRKKHAIKLGVQRLADLRSAGGGPRFIKPSREVRYPVAMVDEWAAQRNAKPILDFVPVKPSKEGAAEADADADADAESAGERESEHTDAPAEPVDATEEARRARALALSPRWR